MQPLPPAAIPDCAALFFIACVAPASRFPDRHNALHTISANRRIGVGSDHVVATDVAGQVRILLRNALVRSWRGASKNVPGGASSTIAPGVHEHHAVGDLAGKAHLVGDARPWSCRRRPAAS